MDQVLNDINNGKYKGTAPPKKKVSLTDKEIKRKENWYKIGEVLLKGHKPKLHKESAVSARRTYRYYSIDYGNWEGPSPRELGKMNEKKFNRLLAERSPSELNITLDEVQGIIIEDLHDWDPENDGTFSF